MRRGFTIVELLITMVVMVILMTLGVFSMRSVQANARDSERQSDVDTIARGLEQYYDAGNPYVKSVDNGGFTTKGSYPGANEFVHIQGTSFICGSSSESYYTVCQVPGGYFSKVLPGVSDAALTPPGKSSPAFESTWQLDDARIKSDLQAGMYVYKPMVSGGTSGPVASGMCYGQDNNDSFSCPAFEIYYIKETSTAPYPGNVVTVKSRHQQ